MKALSIRQPWINAILSGVKTIEVRARPTRHRGPHDLQASRVYGSQEREEPERLQKLGLGVPEPDVERLGAILGQVKLVDCRLMQPEDWDAALAEPRQGRYWAWVMSEPKRLRKPLWVRGQRMLFEVEPS
jgi:hypothetical protein